MITFFVSLLLLIGSYFIYGALVERIFGPDDRPTPCSVRPDGVDYLPLKPWRAFMIQLLNIAGLGPIFGALAGALWGPVVFLWIVFGTIFAGAVHDYLSGMISLRHFGASYAEITGHYLGPVMKNLLRVLTVVLMIAVGAIFIIGPAKLLALLTPDAFDTLFWVIVIFIYYLLATLLPIDQLIGRIYPIFGIALIIMCIGVSGGIVLQDYTIPELNLSNMHPDDLPIWPLMFITVACGAISGFHATQSPMMARCMTSEKQGRFIFYGSMVAEGVIALIWAAAGAAFYDGTGGLASALSVDGPSNVVYNISTGLLGTLGGALAMLGVVACPITTGDTALRGARLTIADWFRIDQKSIPKRLALTLPMFAVVALLTQVDFMIIWRYFAWVNQTLAMITLWACAVYLSRHRRNVWIAAVPATFMSVVCCSYILMAKEGFMLSGTIALLSGIVFAAACLGCFYFVSVRHNSHPAVGSSKENQAPVV